MRQTIHISVHSDAINGISLTSSTQTILVANCISASIQTGVCKRYLTAFDPLISLKGSNEGIMNRDGLYGDDIK